MKTPRHSRATPGSNDLSGASDEPLLSGSAMHEQYGGLLRPIFERLFGPIHYPADSAEQIRDMARRGTIVYVARASSTWLALYFNHALSRLGLPLARFVGGINLLLWQPVDQLWKLLAQSFSGSGVGWRARYGDQAPNRKAALLADFALRGEAAFLFLHTHDSAPRLERQSSAYLRALVAAQHVIDEPIFLVPHAMTDRALSGQVRDSLRQRLFGGRRRPGRTRHLRMPLSGAARLATVRVGEAIDLRQLVTQHPDDDDTMLARRVRHMLERRISEEERVVAGPVLPGFDTVARHVLRDPGVRAAVEAEAKRSGKTPDVLTRKARRYIREIAARYTAGMVAFIGTVMRWAFTRIYDGITVDEAGLARVVSALRSGPVIFCPAHRSHVDYLVLSLTLWDHGLAPPHIAAGANLAFFPLGTMFRYAGAFFLRRTFRDNPIYAATFRAYIVELLRQGTSLEFFIEGGRSRTGKHLMPKFGFLSMVVDAWRRGARDDVRFVPISIDYERIIEAGSYEQELKGAEKKREDIGGLLRTTRVLRSRYGRVHVQFGEPLSLAAHASAAGLPQSAVPEHDDDWRAETERLGYRILHRIAMVSTVTPTSVVATALLGHPGRGIARSALIARSHDIAEFLHTATARLSAPLFDLDSREAAVLEAVQRLVEEGSVSVDRPGRSDAEPIYHVPDDRRVGLDFYKNSVMNYFAPSAIICRAINKRGGGKIAYRDVFEDSRFLSRLFKREFLFRVGTSFQTLFDESLATLAVRGMLDVSEDGSIEVREPDAVTHLAGLLDCFVEGYWVAATTATELRSFPLWRKELSLRAMERARRAFLEGEIRRPESAGRTLTETAIAWMVATGVVTSETDGRRQSLRLAPDYEAEKLDQLIGDIAAFL
ncbi:MAG: 1-acyl-sn-glycerol-3-phosphate acyltransferase [Myxococcota bacterium]